MGNIIAGIAISIILPIVFGFFYRLKEKEEKKIVYGSEFTVKMSKGIVLFFLIWMIFCFLGMVGGVILILATEAPNENQAFWIIEVISFIFFLLGCLGYAIGKYNYLVVKEEGIYLRKIFKKDRLIRYSDITYINSHSYGFGQVACYDSNGVPLFEIDHYYIGIEQLDSTLRNKGYVLLPTPYPCEDMKNNSRFQHYKKMSSTKVGFWCFLLLGTVFLLLGILIHSISGFTNYENYEVFGVVEKYKTGEETLELHLKDDEKTYYINGIVYDELNEDVYNVLNEDTNVKLYIGYQDKFDRHNISQMEIDGCVYLHMDAAELAEYSNYRGCLICGHIFMGIGFILLFFGLAYFVKLQKLKRAF